MTTYIMYSYPMWHRVSFTLIAEKHVEYMKKVLGVDIYTIDELAVPSFNPVVRYRIVLHPYFFTITRVLEHHRVKVGEYVIDTFTSWRSKFDKLIGVDVCDSDSYSRYAVELANLADTFVVPSRFCVDVARKSGIKAKIFRVPHGVDPEWYTLPNQWETAPVKSINPALLEIYLYKIKKNKKVILFWLMHSGWRKGWYQVREVYTRLVRKRNDVVLVLKTGVPNPIEYQQVMQYGCINLYGWLTDYEKMVLYDLADVVLNFSVGGGFELNCLEALARGVPCIANEYGSWTEYVPEFLRVKKGRKVQPLPNNAIHIGYGYTVDVDHAEQKLNEVLDNIDEYKAKTLEWRDKVLAKEYRWDVVAKKLYEAIMS